jgi:hypothetical protein
MIEMAPAMPAPIENTAATNSNETKNISILNTLVIARGDRRNLLCSAVECQDISGTEYLKRPCLLYLFLAPLRKIFAAVSSNCAVLAAI